MRKGEIEFASQIRPVGASPRPSDSPEVLETKEAGVWCVNWKGLR
ncbi:hypothetical protein SAMN05444287_2888 [Octadecabacter temperatus]|uniref:Uncharacterized protein n=1 Tax=Octadecabacter temperatus TaxID=1458307 RepID=A0A0K0Y926_9RHOB|nr:hypothetical protein OSB_29450 [Octadecabacter temperatus]SIO42385.1 hypothetical protein SAMN05444287_2888 [Octadecabacter temperatus]